MPADLVELVQRLGRPRVLVVGDVMLDRYVWGNAERISQEAPVILLRADTREERLRGADVVLVSDYDKGVCTPGLLARVIRAAKERGVRVIADPTRGGDYSKYRGCSGMTPNRLEAGLATGRTIATTEQALAAAAEL